MASSSKNVKLGTCTIFYGGVDLGLTKGGVEVAVATATHEVTVDQYGSTPISELITGRTVGVTVPLVETTLENLVGVMPGAVLVTDGVKAKGVQTIAAQPANGNTVVFSGKTFTFKTGAAVAKTDVVIGASVNATAANLAAVITAADVPYKATSSTDKVTIEARFPGPEYNATVTVTGTGVTKSDLTGGTASTKARVDVPTGVNINLLDYAQTLRLRPIGTNGEWDFVVHRAACPGAMTFSYQTENERIFNAEFKGYVDVEKAGALFSVGDEAA